MSVADGVAAAAAAAAPVASPAVDHKSDVCTICRRKCASLPDHNKLHAVEIIPLLFLGNEAAAKTDVCLGGRIKNVVNVAASRVVYKVPADTKSLELNWRDDEDFIFGAEMDRAVAFVDTARAKAQPVLVHCVQGKSRSVSVVCAYLMHFLAMTYDDALALVKAKTDHLRKAADRAQPNEGFCRQLRELERKLKTLPDAAAAGIAAATVAAAAAAVATAVSQPVRTDQAAAHETQTNQSIRKSIRDALRMHVPMQYFCNSQGLEKIAIDPKHKALVAKLGVDIGSGLILWAPSEPVLGPDVLD
jgi:protein-tyrosine phosphatase